MGLWNELPFDLLNKIGEHLVLYQDKVRSKCVCTHWELSLFPDLPDLRQEQPPWLLLPLCTGSFCGLFHPLEKKLFAIDLPEAGEYALKGSDHGWVVTAKQNRSIDVVNPLTRARVALPPRHKFFDVLEYNPEKVGAEYLLKDIRLGCPYVSEPNSPEYSAPEIMDSKRVRDFYLHNIAFSCAPTRGDDFRAVAIYGETRRFAYCKLGDEKWTDMVEPNTLHACKDMAFCGGKLYVLTNRVEFMVCDDIVSCPKLRTLVLDGKPRFYAYEVGLIKSLDGEIMLSHMRSREKPCGRETYNFEFYKPDLTSSSWIRIRSMACDEIMFMGGLGTQVSMRGRSGNQIYFTHYRIYYKGLEKVDGVMRYKDKKVESLGYEDIKVESIGYEFNPKMIVPCMMWVMPNPY